MSLALKINQRIFCAIKQDSVTPKQDFARLLHISNNETCLGTQSSWYILFITGGQRFSINNYDNTTTFIVTDLFVCFCFCFSEIIFHYFVYLAKITYICRASWVVPTCTALIYLQNTWVFRFVNSCANSNIAGITSGYYSQSSMCMQFEIMLTCKFRQPPFKCTLRSLPT